MMLQSRPDADAEQHLIGTGQQGAQLRCRVQMPGPDEAKTEWFRAPERTTAAAANSKGTISRGCHTGFRHSHTVFHYGRQPIMPLHSRITDAHATRSSHEVCMASMYHLPLLSVCLLRVHCKNGHH